MNVPAPAQFVELGLAAEKFSVSDKKSWRGPCPACGGHRRYVVFTDKEFPLWHGFCDQCGRKDKFWQGRMRIDDRTVAQLNAQMEAERIELDRARQQRLNEFSVSEIWRNLHERLGPAHKQWWRSQGIPEDWQQYYQLGFKSEHHAEHNGEKRTYPAYSIPKFDFGRRLVNIDYRLIDAPHDWGKYRPQQGLSPAVFLSNPDAVEFPEVVHIVEGSKKAMVCDIYLSGSERLFFVGVPSCNSWAGITDRLKDRRVYIMLDPGAEKWSSSMARKIGANARIISLPEKPDDLAITGALYYGRLEYLKKTARGVM